MSLVKLLTQYPNYSARRVRRLANQLAYLENINSKEAKGIAEDLMEFNLLQAQVEQQMNDDVKVETEREVRSDQRTERINVTPTSEALRAIELLNDGSSEAHAKAKQAKGIVYGSSFYTDRTIIVESENQHG